MGSILEVRLENHNFSEKKHYFLLSMIGSFFSVSEKIDKFTYSMKINMT